MACLSSLDSNSNGFEIAHFTHQNNIRIFAEGGLSASLNESVWL
jgi:hypothetical protein